LICVALNILEMKQGVGMDQDKPKAGRTVAWGHLVLLVIIVGSALAYLIDARGTSLKLNNLALVQPAAIMTFILAAIVLSQAFPHTDPGTDTPAVRAEMRAELWRVGLLAAAFGVFVFSLEKLGFDFATLMFVSSGLYLCGERRWWVIVLYSTVFTYLVVMGYQQLVPYPFPMMVL
jgi:hypothetical protein